MEEAMQNKEAEERIFKRVRGETLLYLFAFCTSSQCLLYIPIQLRFANPHVLQMEILLKCFRGSSSSSTSTKQLGSTTIEYLGHRFSLSQLRKSTNDFHKSLVIGEGPYGVAYRASISVNGQLKDLTVKRLRQQSANSSRGFSLYKNDIIFMCQLHHPNLVSFVGFCDDHNEMIVVYDYAPNGSLHQIYRIESNSPTLSWKRRLEIGIGVARGLHYLHSGTKHTIIHGNIAPSTILLGENWVPKLNFFGRSLKGPKFSAKDMKPIQLEYVEGPWGYIAPECFSAPNVTYKCDVYSFGVILLELICGKTLSQISQHKGLHIDTANVIPFTFSVVKDIVRNLAITGNGEGIIDERLVGEIAPQCLKLYMEITESCLSEDPNERPHMGEVEVQLEPILQLQEEADSNHD